MNSRLIIFNIIYYLTTLTFYYQGHLDPSSSLGYGFYILGFWIVSGITLIYLIIKNKIQVKNNWDKLGVFIGTPIIFILTVLVGLSMTDKVGSVWYQNKDGYRYQFVTYSYKSMKTMRTEIYKSQESITKDNVSYNSIKWLRDSTWVYFSETGDTLKIEKYRNDKKLE
jgi:hypothetical protein